jgi:FkbM family methyltransferase
VFDIGGNCGGFSHAVLKRGAQRVICCEPYPKAAAVARENLAPYGERTSVRQVVVFDGSVSEVELRGHDAKPGDSTNIAVAGVLEGHHVALAPDGLRVPATTLDALLEKCGHVDLLKLDCEGSEYAILLAATRLNQVGRITCEWHRSSWNGRAWDAAGLAELLTARGWQVDNIAHTAATHGTLLARNPAWPPPLPISSTVSGKAAVPPLVALGPGLGIDRREAVRL